MFKIFLKFPILLSFLTVFALAGCGDQNQSSTEQPVEESVDQTEEAVSEEAEEQTTQQ